MLTKRTPRSTSRRAIKQFRANVLNVPTPPPRQRLVTPPPPAPKPVPASNPGDFDLPLTPTLEKLQGEWLPLSLVTSGVPLQESYLPYGNRTQQGNETKVVFGGQAMVHALMRIDESASKHANS